MLISSATYARLHCLIISLIIVFFAAHAVFRYFFHVMPFFPRAIRYDFFTP